jgi:hypothetical protein
MPVAHLSIRKTNLGNMKKKSGICFERLSKTTKPSVMTAGLGAENWTREIQGTKQECYPLHDDGR